MFPAINKLNIKKFNKKGLIKKRAIVLNTNGKYIFACGTMIINIIDKIKDFDNIIVYYSDISEKEIHKLLQIDSRIICEEITIQSLNNDFFAGEQIIENNDFIARYTYLCISKIILFQLLEKYGQVVFFDLDMLILDNLDEILNKKEYNIIWKSDNTNILSKILMFSRNYKETIELDIYKKIITPNGGLLILNRNFDYELAFNTGKEFIRRCMQKHPFLIDELAFGYIAYKNNLKVYNVNENIYDTVPYNFTTETILPHFYRDFKTWNSEIIQLLYPQWGKYYEKLVHLTGIKSDEVKIYKDVHKLIGEERYYKTWVKLLETVKFPETLEKPIDINKQEIEFKYNNNLSYFIKTNFEARSFCTGIRINKEDISEISYINDQIDNILKLNPNIKADRKESNIVLSLSWYPLKDIIPKFIYIYDVTFILRSILNNVFINSFKCGYLTTFFNQYVFLCANKMMQTNNLSMTKCLNIYFSNNKIFFKLNGDDTYINNIYLDGTITLSKKIMFFDCINDNKKNYIKINNLFLSARNDGSISLMPHAREWECFKFESRT